MINLKIRNQEIFKYVSGKIKFFQIETNVKTERIQLGFDPGSRKIGLAYIYPDSKLISGYQILPNKFEDEITRILAIKQLIEKCLPATSSIKFHTAIATIEGASFSRTQGYQSTLGEIRGAVSFFLYDRGFEVPKFPAPNSVRKKVFGNGKTKAKDIWKFLPDDLAASIGCMYYSSF